MATIAIDVGQSRARAALWESSAAREVEALGPAIPLASRGAATRVGRRLARLLVRLRAVEPVEVVCVGLSGFDGPEAQARPVATAIASASGAHHVIIANDVVPWYLAVLGSEPGVVAAVGTGAVTIASDGTGSWARTDGCGHLLGDDASGFWVGRAGLASSLRAADGRGGSPVLLERAVAAYGSASAIGVGVYGARSPVMEVAAFARQVAEAAREGDAEALGIWDAAGRAVARSVVGAWRRVFANGDVVPVCLVGSLTQAGPLLVDPCREALWEHGLEPRVSDADPLTGVRGLAEGATHQFQGLLVDWRGE